MTRRALYGLPYAGDAPLYRTGVRPIATERSDPCAKVESGAAVYDMLPERVDVVRRPRIVDELRRIRAIRPEAHRTVKERTLPVDGRGFPAACLAAAVHTIRTRV